LETPAFSLINSTAAAYNILRACVAVGGNQYTNTKGDDLRPSFNVNGYDSIIYLGELSGSSSTSSSIEVIGVSRESSSFIS